MATVKIFPRKSKMNKAGLVPLVIRITQNRKSQYINLGDGVYIDLKQWNDKTNRMKPGAPNATRINNLIAQREAEVQSTILDSSLKEEHLDVGELKSRISGNVTNDFFNYSEKMLESLKRGNKVSSYKREKSIVDKFREFNRSDKLKFDQINVSFLKRYEDYLRIEKENGINTIHSNFRVIRKIIKAAVREGIISEDLNPFNRFQLKLEKTKREFLLDDELAKLEKLELQDGSPFDIHRKLYVFSAYAGGIRISDLLLLKWRDISDGRVTFQIKKTGEQVTIKLPTKALEILASLKKYAKIKENSTGLNDFVFPVLKIEPDEQDPWKIQQSISSSTAYINKNLKFLVPKAGIEKKISFHTARHSFAVRALQKGMRIEYVSKLLAHSSVKQSEVYAKIVNEELDKAMNIFNE